MLEEGPRDHWGQTTLSDGSFDLDTLPPGSFDLLVTSPEWPEKASARARKVRSGTTDVEILLPDGRPIAGRVRLPDGRPAAHVYLSVRREGTTACGTATDREGRFRTEPLAPASIAWSCTRAERIPGDGPLPALRTVLRRSLTA